MKNDITTVRNDIIHRVVSGDTYEQVGFDLGVNRGTVWKIHKDPKYRPTVATLHKLGLTKEPRRLRLVAQVTEAEYNAVKAAAEREGETMAEYIRRRMIDAP